MTAEILAKYSDVVVVNSGRIALDLSLKMANEPKEVQVQAYGGDRATGNFYMFRDEIHPGKVYECVVSSDGDSIAAVYLSHRIFDTRADLTRAREEIINAVAASLGLSVEGVGIEDDARGRSVGLAELATGQLIDMLASRTTGKNIIVTNNHSAAGLVKADTSIQAGGGGHAKAAPIKNMDMEKHLRDLDRQDGNAFVSVL